MPTTIQLLKTVYPHHSFPVPTTRPTFHWRSSRKAADIDHYALKVIALKEKQDAAEALRRNQPVLALNQLTHTSIDYPCDTKPLRHGSTYAYQLSAYDRRGKVVSHSNIGMFYIEPDNLPFSLSELLCCDDGLLKNNITAWQPAYGAPNFSPRSTGCLGEKGTITLTGNAVHGDAVWQATSDPLQAGKRYSIHFCARFIPKQDDYVKLRVFAFNGTLPNSGAHPSTTAEIQIIGETSRLTTESWTRIMLPPWQAHHDFDHVAILAVTDEANDPHVGYGEISDICLSTYTGKDCGLTADVLAADGTIDLPDSLAQYADPNSEPATASVNFGRGAAKDMLGDMFGTDGSLRWYQKNDPCASFGGNVPPGLVEQAEQPYDLGADYKLDDVAAGMKEILEILGNEPKKREHFKPIPPVKNQCCDEFRPHKNKPFGGRDIIYLHGFQPKHVADQILRRYEVDTGSTTEIDAGIEDRYPVADLTAGFYGKAATRYWRCHIQHYLGSLDTPSNRYLVCSFNSNQRVIENVHAVLRQIRDAMSEGKGVVYSEKDPRKAKCFGQNAIIISHSTGALVADVALAMASFSEDDTTIRDYLGDVSYIPKHFDCHVSLHGAIAGSELASLAVVGANVLAGVAPTIDGAVDVGISGAGIADSVAPQWIRDALTGFRRDVTSINNALDTLTDELVVFARHAVQVVNGSVLVDLSSVGAKLLWGETIEKMPVPVLTVAGGHPLSISKIPLRGFDDGVVNTNSQSGSPSFLHPDQYTYTPPALHIFDMGIPLERSSLFFIDQYEGIGKSAYGSIPFISPTGMLQPVGNTPLSLPRYHNHFTFLQSASDHQSPIDDPITAGDANCGGPLDHLLTEYNPTLMRHNYEETLVVTDSFVFTSGLVNPNIISLVNVCTRGVDLIITLRFLVPRFTLIPPSFTFQTLTLTFTIPVWRRTYFTLQLTGSCAPWDMPSEIDSFISNTEPKQETDYVYEFVLR